jgi:hypothetical protein
MWSLVVCSPGSQRRLRRTFTPSGRTRRSNGTSTSGFDAWNPSSFQSTAADRWEATPPVARVAQSIRCVDLFEYQGKQFFASLRHPGVPGEAVTTVDEAVAAAERLNTYPVVVKAQVQVGGRGKAGGIKLANDADEVRLCTPATSSAWTSRATPSTGVDRARLDIAEEYYASFTLDRAKKHLGMLSAPRAAWRSKRWPKRTPTPSPRSGSTRSTASTRRRPDWVAAANLNPDATDGVVDILVKLYTASPRATPTWPRSTR